MVAQGIKNEALSLLPPRGLTTLRMSGCVDVTDEGMLASVCA